MSRLPSLSIISAAILLSACGGGGGSGTPTHSVTSTASLGALVGANCTAKDIRFGTSFTGTTNSDGIVVFNGVPDSAGTLLVSCTGGSYFDEATKNTVSLTTTLESVVPAGNNVAAITPLTNIVAALVKQAIANVTNPSIAPADLNAVAKQVADVYAPGVDLLSPPKPVRSSADVTTIGNADNANRYAAALAALSQLASTAGKPLDQVVTAITSDVADGIIGNGLNAINVTSPAALATNLNTAQATITPSSQPTTPRPTTAVTVSPPKAQSNPNTTGATG